MPSPKLSCATPTQNCQRSNFIPECHLFWSGQRESHARQHTCQYHPMTVGVKQLTHTPCTTMPFMIMHLANRQTSSQTRCAWQKWRQNWSLSISVSHWLHRMFRTESCRGSCMKMIAFKIICLENKTKERGLALGFTVLHTNTDPVSQH